MSTASRLNRRALSISTAAATVLGTFSFVTPRTVALPACTAVPLSGINIQTTPPPAAVRIQAQNAANAASDPNVTLSRYNQPASGSNPRVFEVRGRQNSNAGTNANPGANCLLEADVVVNSSNQPIGVEEIEEQLASLSVAPLAVRNGLRNRLPEANFRVTFVELSQRYSPPEAYPTGSVNTGITLRQPDTVRYEIQGTCLRNITLSDGRICGPGLTITEAEALLTPGGTVVEVESAS